MFYFKNVIKCIFIPLLTDNEVYAWGNNAMGQCGQGHAQSPLTRPRKVIGLDGVNIHQISAGTSHSVAWTSLPIDRYCLHQENIDSLIIVNAMLAINFVCHMKKRRTGQTKLLQFRLYALTEETLWSINYFSHDKM